MQVQTCGNNRGAVVGISIFCFGVHISTKKTNPSPSNAGYCRKHWTTSGSAREGTHMIATGFCFGTSLIDEQGPTQTESVHIVCLLHH